MFGSIGKEYTLGTFIRLTCKNGDYNERFQIGDGMRPGTGYHLSMQKTSGLYISVPDSGNSADPEKVDPYAQELFCPVCHKKLTLTEEGLWD